MVSPAPRMGHLPLTTIRQLLIELEQGFFDRSLTTNKTKNLLILANHFFKIFKKMI
jgi:hypothetical protein